ncbi:hypothetical protein SAMN05216167_12710 [Spirosoma endophyticum]|uniref:Uncharacterized protein n=1 Tax=Spirosoma endophyticum TaxID=662367 RepID=A0A1I2FPS2_9BACT|nr:hypothetical protein SAMN05216167_12710 [Spirosoma endophyticum]
MESYWSRMNGAARAELIQGSLFQNLDDARTSYLSIPDVTITINENTHRWATEARNSLKTSII